MARKSERDAERRGPKQEEWREAGQDRSPDRGGRAMRGEVDYDRAYTDEDEAFGRPDYGAYGGYGRAEGALRNWRGSAYGGAGRGEGEFGSYRGSSDWYEGGYDERGRNPVMRDRQSGDRGYSANSGYMDRGAEPPRGGRRGERDFFERATDEVSSWFGDDDAARRREQDHHRGRGPRGYTRSDDRIAEDVNDRLTEDGMVDASDITVAVSGREVTLSGDVETRAQRRRAEDIAEMVSGVTHVQNNLRVRDRQAKGYGRTATG